MEMARTAQATAQQQGYLWIGAQASLAQASILASQPQGDTEQAMRLLFTTMDIASKIEAKPLLAICHTLIAGLLSRNGDSLGATAQFRQAIGLFAEMKMTRQLDSATAALSASGNSLQ